ncbi:MAG: hypothetical protein PF439_05090 [Helicobacteraceae bacterium]|jgi:hypothetical protein|nr:hypothetical protein [Helicobacteraceae bacterium]
MKISSATFEKAKILATAWQSKIEQSREHTEKKFHEVMKQVHYFREQRVSNFYHRYGNLGLNGLKKKES